MNTVKKLFAPVVLGAAMALCVGAAFALNVGDSGSFDEMKAKLVNENQTEIATAATGKAPNYRGVKFYYNHVSKIGYIALTNDPIRPTQMRIIVQTTKTNPTVAVQFPDELLALARCDKLVADGSIPKDSCGSFKATLEIKKSSGQEVFQQGILPSLNIMTSFINPATGVGSIEESTKDGATVMKLPFGDAKFTPEGARMLARK